MGSSTLETVTWMLIGKRQLLHTFHNCSSRGWTRVILPGPLAPSLLVKLCNLVHDNGVYSCAPKSKQTVTAAIKWSLLLGRIAIVNLDHVLKSRDITLLTKVCIFKAMVFPVVMYGCESWTIKKAEHQRTDAFKLWCWRRLLRPLDSRDQTSQSWRKLILDIHWKNWC